MKYRKKPVVIEAMEWTGDNTSEVVEWGNGVVEPVTGNSISYYAPKQLRISTLEGVMFARPGDFIIKGVEGEFYPCKPNIFKQTYEAVE